MKYNCYHSEQCSKHCADADSCIDCAFYTPAGDDAERAYIDEAIERQRIAFRSEWFTYTDYFFA